MSAYNVRVEACQTDPKSPDLNPINLEFYNFDTLEEISRFKDLIHAAHHEQMKREDAENKILEISIIPVKFVHKRDDL